MQRSFSDIVCQPLVTSYVIDAYLLYLLAMLMMKDDLRQKWRVKLIFQGTYRLSGTGIVECLKIIDVGCNLKQFDVEADRCIFHFRP